MLDDGDDTYRLFDSHPFSLTVEYCDVSATTIEVLTDHSTSLTLGLDETDEIVYEVQWIRYPCGYSLSDISVSDLWGSDVSTWVIADVGSDSITVAPTSASHVGVYNL